MNREINVPPAECWLKWIQEQEERDSGQVASAGQETPIRIDREFEFYEFFSFLKFNEFY